jgi:LysR family nitrogen assimilation transcriptional regulator
MDFRELRYFSYVAELKSFSRAASQLRISQPAISRCISALESELGATLLQRHGRGVTLTDAGQTLYDRAQLLLHGLKQASEDVAATGIVPRGHLRLAVPPAAGEVLAPPLLARYRALYPQVSIHLHEGFSGYMNEWLMSGRVDIAVMHNPVPQRSLEIQHLLIERMFVVVPGPRSEGYNNWPRLEAYQNKDLAKLPLILPSRPHSLRLLMEQLAEASGIDLNITLEVDGLPTIKSLIARGLGATVLAYVAVTKEVSAGMLTAVPLQPGIQWRLCVASHRERNRTVAARELIRLIVDEVHDLVQLGVWQGSRDIER